jgi:hypothetical protein
VLINLWLLNMVDLFDDGTKVVFSFDDITVVKLVLVFDSVSDIVRKLKLSYFFQQVLYKELVNKRNTISYLYTLYEKLCGCFPCDLISIEISFLISYFQTSSISVFCMMQLQLVHDGNCQSSRRFSSSQSC